MDVTTAYAVLSLKPETTLDEASKAFGTQASRCDPERVQRNLRPAAEVKRAQVGEAWNVVRLHLESGGGPVTYQVDPPREPSPRVSPTVTEPRQIEHVPGPEAGWYGQPDGRQRYWDGEQWAGRPVRAVRAKMSFPAAVGSGLSKYVDFSGRARRSEFWFFQLFYALTGLAGLLLDVALDSQPLMQGLMTLGLILPLLAVTVRRLHDIDRTWWSCFLLLVPVVSWVAFLVFGCTDSDEDPNRFGPSPKYV